MRKNEGESTRRKNGQRLGKPFKPLGVRSKARRRRSMFSVISLVKGRLLEFLIGQALS